MDSPLCLSINGVMWHHPPLCSLQTRASFIKSRPVAVESSGDWSAYGTWIFISAQRLLKACMTATGAERMFRRPPITIRTWSTWDA